MKNIYCFCLFVEDAAIEGDVMGYAIDEQYKIIATHHSSSEAWSLHDMVTSGWKDDKYREIYPEGYTVNWVGHLHTAGAFKTLLNRDDNTMLKLILQDCEVLEKRIFIPD